MIKKHISLVLVFIAIVILIHNVISNLSLYTAPYDYGYHAGRYSDSQYTKSSAGRYIIPDEELYAYAGYYYIKGGEVSRVNFENPPLGKYAIGLSILLFGNPLVIYPLYVILYLIATYFLGIIIFQNKLVSSLAVLLLVIDPYIHQALKFSMLDFPCGLFFLTGLIFYLKAKKYWHYALAFLFFGISFATKFFPFLIIALLCLFIYQCLKRRKKMKYFLAALPVFVLAYLLSYLEYFSRNNLLDFIRYQWWVLHWRMGNPRVLGNAFRTIFTGSFKPWWPTTETIHSYTDEWSLFVPFLCAMTMTSIFFFWRNKFFRYFYLFIWIYFVYINVGTEGGLKYLAPFYGLFAVISSATIIKIVEIVKFRLFRLKM